MKKKIVISFLILIAVVIISIFTCNSIIVKAAKDKLYSDINELPYRRVGILLGTSPKMVNGYPNPFYKFRVEAATELIKKKKIKYLVISGDNGTKYYDEPDAIRADLIKMGIDSSVLYLDFAGFRTFDSIRRLKEIFGQDSATVISQQFHNERAIYIGKKEGINLIGFNARDISTREGLRTEIREKLARVKVFIDGWINTKPRYLGSKVVIPN